jgi:23S rRNA pseudouridine2604 synthase
MPPPKLYKRSPKPSPARPASASDPNVRINKFFTQQGLCSRREADRLIEEGRVTINGRRATLGDQVSPGDVVAKDGLVLSRGNEPVYIKFHKPIGVTTTTESDVPDNIIAYIGHPQRIFPVGRLDKDSSGLILLTNDGEIVNRVLRAEHGHEKEYLVRVNRPFDQAFLDRMATGVTILGTPTRPCTVVRRGRQEFRIILTEGRNRQIRRMCQALGYRVVALHRTRIMHVELGDLPAGQWKNLSEGERTGLLATLRRAKEGATS